MVGSASDQVTVYLQVYNTCASRITFDEAMVSSSVRLWLGRRQPARKP